MEFVKIYSTAVPNAARTLDKRVAIAPLLARIRSDSVKASLALIQNHGEVHFWDFGVRATPQLSPDDSVKIICGTTCYSGRVIRIINDPSGELGDQLDWTRQLKAPWKMSAPYPSTPPLPSARQGSRQLPITLSKPQITFTHHCNQSENQKH